MVAVEFRTELEDTDLDRTLAARLSCRPVGRLPGVHGREATGCALQVSVLPRRGPLGAATAQSPLVVPFRARAGGVSRPDLGGSPACGARASRQTQGSRVSVLRRYDGTLYEGL